MGNLQNSYVKLDKVSKIYKMGEVEIRAVDNISFEISKGEFVVVVGPSGAGKTTVLNILGGMDTATKGNVFVDGSNIAKYNSHQLTAYRRAEQTERNAAVRARRIYTQLSNLCEDARTRYMDSGEEIAALAADLSTGLSRLQDAFAEVQVIFDDAQNAFVSAYRKSTKDGKFTVKVEYISCGELEGKTLLLVDPMLATGSSLVLAYNALCERGGQPAHTHVAAVIASEQGVEYVEKNMPKRTTTIWCAAVDEELTSRAYIVPGIGDAGDLAYGEKI